MTQLPSPTGRPATMFPRPDPWEEQRRRDEARRLERRRRRRRWLIPLVLLLLVAGAVVVVLIVVLPSGDDAAPATTDEPTTTPVSSAPEVEQTVPTVPAERLVTVGEVWLLDRGDDVFDWGLSVLVPATGPTRSGVEVTVTLFDDGDEPVDTITRTLDGVNSLIPSTVAGQLIEADAAPVRLEFDITVGTPSADLAYDALLSTRAVRRDGDELTGRIRSSASGEITDVSMVLVWRDDTALDSGDPNDLDTDPNAAPDTGAQAGASDVVAVVVYDIERIRPGVDALFSIDLEEHRAPDGVPDDVLWAPSS